jgi:tRNA-dihydrouridine synthase 1
VKTWFQSLLSNCLYRYNAELSVPVTAKIRVYDDFETSLAYAKMVEAAGAQLIAIHGRTREQKRASDVRANWDFIKEIKKQLNVPVLANGDIRSLDEARACLEATGADGVLSAEPLLENPSLFSDPPFAPPTDPTAPLPVEGDKNCRLLLQYLEMTDKYTTPLRMVKGHIHKMVGPWLSEFTDLRDWLNKEPYLNLTNDALRKWTTELMGRINHVHKTEGRLRPVPKKTERALEREAKAAGLAAAIAEQEREQGAVAGELPPPWCYYFSLVFLFGFFGERRVTPDEIYPPHPPAPREDCVKVKEVGGK